MKRYKNIYGQMQNELYFHNRNEKSQSKCIMLNNYSGETESVNDDEFLT